MFQKLAKRVIGRVVSTNLRKQARYTYTNLYNLAGKDFFPAHNDLDKKLLRHIGDIKNGTFIEAGANDGLSQSNTWHLEKRLGWHGLLVEPVPHIARLCTRFRKGSIVENCALGSFNQQGQEVELGFGGLMTVTDGADTSHMHGGSANSHAASGASWTGDKSYRFKSRIEPLTNLLLKHGITHVDLLSLDVEGFEVPALMGLDISRTPVRYILVETSNLEAVQNVIGRDYTLLEKLSAHDYLFKAAH
jgi:FkbM family methyltransferase